MDSSRLKDTKSGASAIEAGNEFQKGMVQFNNCPDWDLLWARHNLLLISNCCRFVYNGRGILVFLFTQAYRMLIGLHTAKDVNDEKSGYQYIASRANSIFEGVNWNSEFESEDSAYFRAK